MTMDFKFFQQPKQTNYEGEWSQHAIRMVYEYNINRYFGDISVTRDARYVIVDATYERGQLVFAAVKVYPVRDTSMMITFYIAVGRGYPFITQHNIEYNVSV